MAGTEKISRDEFKRRTESGELVIGKKGRLIGTGTSLAIQKASAVISPLAAAPTPANKPNKYGAIKVKDPEGGPDFDSKLEAKHATEYRAMVRAELLFSVARWAYVYLGSGITWKIDFLIQHLDGSIEYVDSKGKDTDEFLLKEKLFRDRYPNIKLTIRRASDKKKEK